LLRPLPILPSVIKLIVPLKFGKLIWKSAEAAITAKQPAGKVKEGIGSTL